MFYDKLQFLRPVTQAGKSKDNLCPDQELLNDTQDEFDQESLSSASPACSEILEPTPRISKKVRKSMEARKENFLSTCVKVLRETTRPQPQPLPIKERCSFSKYVSEKLATFDRRSRMIAEKRISDTLFEIEMNSHNTMTFCWHIYVCFKRWILRTEHSRQWQNSFLPISIYLYLKYSVKMYKKNCSHKELRC